MRIEITFCRQKVKSKKSIVSPAFANLKVRSELSHNILTSVHTAGMNQLDSVLVSIIEKLWQIEEENVKITGGILTQSSPSVWRTVYSGHKTSKNFCQGSSPTWKNSPWPQLNINFLSEFAGATPAAYQKTESPGYGVSAQMRSYVTLVHYLKIRRFNDDYEQEYFFTCWSITKYVLKQWKVQGRWLSFSCRV